MRFSIITVCYNAVHTIEETILSVQRQTFKDYEHIIIDGGSTDGTLEIIDKYREKFSVVVSEPDRGIYDAMNKGIFFSKGTFIAMLNADDYYLDDALEVMYSKIKKSNLYENIVYYGNLIVFDQKIEDGYVVKPLLPNKLNEFMCLNHPTCFVSRNLYQTFSYNIQYKTAADQDLFLRFWRRGNARFIYLNSEITAMKKGGISSKFSSFFEIWEIQRTNEVSFFIRVKSFMMNLFFFIANKLPMNNILKFIYKKFLSKKHVKF